MTRKRGATRAPGRTAGKAGTATKAGRRTREPSFGELLAEGLREVRAIERGQAEPVRMSRVPVTARRATARPAATIGPARVAELRARLGLSQPVFADALNVSAETVRAWEQGKRRPDGAALRLLELAEAHPAWILAVIQPAGSVAGR